MQRLLDAGATVIGKTVCDEFFFSVTGANAHYGTPVNPRAPGRLPGGSSSGSASATAAGACDFALGSDTGGSVRIPAALCGLYGLRPTHGRVNLECGMPMAQTFDTAGWFASGAGLFRNVGAVLLEGDRRRAAVQSLLIAEDAFAQADAAVATVLRKFLARAADRLPGPQAVTLAPEGFDPWRNCFRVLQGFEVWQNYGDFVTTRHPSLGPGIRERMAYAASVTREDADGARAALARYREGIRRAIPPGTVVCLPTAPCIAPETSISGDQLDAFRSRVMALTCTAGVAGLPQVTLPVGTVQGCPVALSFLGWAGGDEVLLELAALLGMHCGA